jgi:hypothetical protein
MSTVVEAPATTIPQGEAGGLRGMVWLTWRQQRWTLITTLTLAAVLVGWMAYLSVLLTGFYHQCHDTYCPPDSPQGLRLAGSSSLVFTLDALSRLVQYTPLLIGLFIGVPVFSREHEQRTLLLAWSQDISPTRWLWTKLGLLGLFVAAVSAAISWVSDYLERIQTEVSPGTLFDYLPFLNTAMLPLVLSLCWFAVGVALGAAARRTLPAVFGVIAGFFALTYLVQWRYPTLMKPLSVHIQAGQRPGVLQHNALVVSGGMINYGTEGPSGAFDAAGRSITGVDLQKLCPPDNNGGGMVACWSQHHLGQHVLYQPGSRIPEFHLIVAAGYLGLAAVAVAAVWWIVRRTNLSAG